MAWGLSGPAPVAPTRILSPADASGAVVAAATWAFSGNLTLDGRGYAPHGRPSRTGVLGSEYGAAPRTGLLQISFSR